MKYFFFRCPLKLKQQLKFFLNGSAIPTLKMCSRQKLRLFTIVHVYNRACLQPMIFIVRYCQMRLPVERLPVFSKSLRKTAFCKDFFRNRFTHFGSPVRGRAVAQSACAVIRPLPQGTLFSRKPGNLGNLRGKFWAVKYRGKVQNILQNLRKRSATLKNASNRGYLHSQS